MENYPMIMMIKTFGNLYNVKSNSEKFNSLDNKCVDRKINNYHFTFRQGRPSGN